MKNFVASLLVLGLVQATWAAPTTPVIDVYKSPTCGCCNKWIDHLKANGFTVRAHDTENVQAHKVRLGVPPGYGSCHTAEVNGYVIEGHVPAKEMKRLLKEKPRARGLVVPAMPVGSPGMEAGGRMDPYDVFLVNRDGSTRTYAQY
ncbi:MAG: metal-binding protein [Thiobacillus sp. 63-78]|uniref:DUF411 domain-containing protein n=1 Tax=Thiobacillus sp. 63-78 TaxID=1895859 RepID=UPI000868703A|nr:DUF411 domain-containing protein [Thiobacillus sp. 63-78]MBN8760222.1 DUF411 domain-containing protein [Thiobacillus sp.]ODU85645.1 MAG: metal-binding protein [Thiobacillus sp. SCN 65-179]OJZ12112.1 MAG: metal-binding protein [Thiobacillus sp. 63-78]